MLVRVLGPLAVEGDAQGPSLGGFKQRVVLALLALQPNQFVGVEQLVENVWRERPPSRPRKTLQVYVANLRREIGPAYIEFGQAGYRLSLATVESDLLEFRAQVERARRADAAERAAVLESALSWCQGRSVAELCDNTAVAQLAGSVDAAVRAVQNDHLQIYLELGQGARFVPALRARLLIDPLNEEDWVLLMRAEYQAGRQREALAAFHEARRLLDDELGVEPGPRLAELHAEILRHDPSLRPTADAATPDAPPERRTVVFVVGQPSQALADEVDPEEAEDMGQRLAMSSTECVTPFGGVMVSSSHRGVGVAFGLLHAADDTAAQSAEAALALASTLNLKVGVHLGTTLVGHGTSIADAPAAHVAARLAGRARPGEVKVSYAVERLLATRFELGGADSLIPAINSIDERVRDRTFTLNAKRGPVLVAGHVFGREPELAHVVHLLSTDGGSRVVVVHGAAGIGKSALVAAAVAQHKPTHAALIVLRAERYHGDRPMSLFVGALHQRYPSAAAAALELEMLGLPRLRSSQLAASLSQLAHWSDASTGTARPADSAAQIRRAAQVWLSALGSQQPLWLVAEDLHFADEESLSVLDAVLDEIKDLTLLATTRAAEGRSSLDTRAQHLCVGPLPRPAARRIIAAELISHRIRLDEVNHILDRAGGHPLYLKALAAAARDGTTQLPVGLEAGLRATLDRLEQDLRRTAVQCAAIGGTFDAKLVAELVSAADDADVDVTSVGLRLGELVKSGVLVRLERGGARGPAFCFASSLLEEVAYQSMPRAARIELHQVIADHLSRKLPQIERDLAHHLELAGDSPRAAALWAGVAGQAVLAGQYPAGATAARRALALSAAVASTPDRLMLELAAQTALFQSINAVTRHDADLVRAIERAQTIARQLGRPDVLVQTSLAAIAAWQAAGHYPKAEVAGEEAIRSAHVIGNQALIELTEEMHGSTFLWQGHLDIAQAYFTPRIRSDAESAALNPYQQYAVCTGLALQAFVLALKNQREQATNWFTTAARTAQIGGDRTAQGVVHLIEATSAQLDRRIGDVRRLTGSALDDALSIGNDWFTTWAQALLGWAQAMGGDPPGGLSMLGEALQEQRPIRQFDGFLHLLLGETQLAAGQADASHDSLQRALLHAEQTGEGVFRPYIYRALTAVHQYRGAAPAATDTQHHARFLAHAQGNHHLLASLEIVSRTV